MLEVLCMPVRVGCVPDVAAALRVMCMLVCDCGPNDVSANTEQHTGESRDGTRVFGAVSCASVLVQYCRVQ